MSSQSRAVPSVSMPMSSSEGSPSARRAGNHSASSKLRRTSGLPRESVNTTALGRSATYRARCSARASFTPSRTDTQQQLGHSTPMVTLNVYAHLFEHDLDRLYEGLDAKFPE